MTENNGEEIVPVVVDIGINIGEGIDPKKATEYLKKLFVIGDKFGELLHKERLTIGEALFVIYLLEKGALGIIDIEDPGDIYHVLSEDNKTRIDIVADIIIGNHLNRSDTTNIE